MLRRHPLRTVCCLTRQRDLLQQPGTQLIQSVIDRCLDLNNGGSGMGDAPLTHPGQDLLALALQLSKQPLGVQGAGLLV